MRTLRLVLGMYLLVSMYLVHSETTPLFSTAFETNWSFLGREPELTLNDYISREPTDAYEIIYDLMKRVFTKANYNPNLINKFKLELIDSHESKETNDLNNILSLNLNVLELDNDGSSIILRGSSIIELGVAFNWYLEEWCNTTYDWSTYTLELPEIFPLPSYSKKIQSVPLIYYENVVTVSYSFAWWDWKEWQTHLDWMVMHGINVPLAFTGTEYVFAKTFYQFGFNETDMQSFFAGPAFYAWQRMGNIQGWGGPLREATIMQQYNLQLQILARMNTFGMSPIMTCFAGHLPNAVTTLFPNASVTKSPKWSGFEAPYCCVYLLNFTDPLFYDIGKTFIEFQTKYYGTSHLYQCDTFNEMVPPSATAQYLQNATFLTYKAMVDADENAIWIMQTWLFLESFWSCINIQNYLSGVDNESLILLDVESNEKPTFSKCDGFFGKAWIYSTMANNGGDQGLNGPLNKISYGIPLSLSNYASIIGVGTSMEGIFQNYVTYDLSYQMGFQNVTMDLDKYITKYAMRRYGLPHSININSDANKTVNTMLTAWKLLKDSVYSINYTNGIHKSLTDYSPSLTLSPPPLYNVTEMQSVWKLFVNIGDSLSNIEKYKYDLVDVSRQCLSNLFGEFYLILRQCSNSNNISCVQELGTKMIAVLTDLDGILLTDIHWMLGPWILLARNSSDSHDNDTLNWYEFNCKNQISLWGPIVAGINNYASKQWGSLIGDYHKPQWQLFFDQLINAMKNGTRWNVAMQNKFNKDNYDEIELPWQYVISQYPINPVNDTIAVACDLYIKWNIFGDLTCV